MHTEDVSPRFTALDTWPPGEIAAALVEGQMSAAASVRAVQAQLAGAAEAAASRLAEGSGRIVYCGAGASGRIGVQDGVELFPTYGWPHERLVYLMAGGEPALIRSVEGAEDDEEGAAAQVAELELGRDDVLIAIAASGRTPYAVAAARGAREAGALVIGISNNPQSALADASDHGIELLTGPEVVAGSTRMAAGTAQKAALNVLSTTIMVRLHRVHENLMVDLNSTNIKLAKRRVQILQRISGAAESDASEALEVAGGHIKTAALILRGCDKEHASRLLTETRGSLRAALGTLSTS
jgi:N-acetylmuramic acid 6-phosphate etherase